MKIIGNYLEKIQEDTEVLKEGIIFTAFLVYVVFMILTFLKADHSNKKLLKLAKEIAPIIEKDLGNIFKKVLPTVINLNKQLYSELLRLKGIDLEILKVMEFSLNQKKEMKILLKPLIDRKNIEEEFEKYLIRSVKAVIALHLHNRKKLKLYNLQWNTNFYTPFEFYFIDDSYDHLPENLQELPEEKMKKYFENVGEIFVKYNKKIELICKSSFKIIEKKITDHLKKN